MDGSEKLDRDLVVLEAMAAEMDEYLRSDVLFWPLRGSDLPRLTLGGYLMRQHRLLELRDLLSMPEQERLHATISRYLDALEEKVVRFENRAHEELEARLRQWREYLRDVKNGSGVAYYPTAVETRAMIRALISQLRVNPYQLNDDIPPQVALLDRELSRFWEPGQFVWPFDWRPAYPQAEYWWLYGRPREQSR
jgi:hypothetical protein